MLENCVQLWICFQGTRATSVVMATWLLRHQWHNICEIILFLLLQYFSDDLDGVNIPQDGIRKSRSHSFSSSLKNLFKKKKKNKHQQQGTGSELYPPSSRESSVSRASGKGYDPAFAQPSPDMSSRDASVRHSPDMNRDYPQYSSSVPVHAPIYDR